MNCGQEMSAARAPGPWRSPAPSSFLAPGEQPDPCVPEAATADLLTVSRGSGTPAKLPRPHPGPWASLTTATRPGHLPLSDGETEAIRRGGPPTGCLSLGSGGAVSQPPPLCTLWRPGRRGQAHGEAPPRGPTQGWGQAPRVPRRAQCRRGLFDQRSRPVPARWDGGQWPNRPHRMPSGPRQECHSPSWCMVTAGGGRAPGQSRPGGCPGASAAFPRPRGQGAPGWQGWGLALETKPIRHSWTRTGTLRPAGVRGRGTEGGRWGRGLLAGHPPPPAPILLRTAPPAPGQLQHQATAPVPEPEPRLSREASGSGSRPPPWPLRGGAGPKVPGGGCDSRARPGPGPDVRTGSGQGSVLRRQPVPAPWDAAQTPHTLASSVPALLGPLLPPGAGRRPPETLGSPRVGTAGRVAPRPPPPLLRPPRRPLPGAGPLLTDVREGGVSAGAPDAEGQCPGLGGVRGPESLFPAGGACLRGWHADSATPSSTQCRSQ